METDRLHHIADRPPQPGDWSAVRAGGRSVFVTVDALPLPPAEALKHLTEIWTYRLRPNHVTHLLSEARPSRLSIHGTHCPQLDFLAEQDRLRALGIDWNNKLAGSTSSRPSPASRSYRFRTCATFTMFRRSLGSLTCAR